MYRITPDKLQQTETHKPRFSEDEIDWNALNQFGVTKEQLEKSGNLELMLSGNKSASLLPINAMIGNVKISTEARLAFRQREDGSVTLMIHGVRQNPELDSEFFGHKFTEEDKHNLMETGNLGRIVQLTDIATDEITPCYVSVDRLTNELIAIKTEYVKIPDQVNGVTLDELEKNTLMAGKAVFVKDMVSENGEVFNAIIQFNADRRGFDFTFDTRQLRCREGKKIEVPPKIGSVTLSEKQRSDIESGKAVLIGGMTNLNGEICSAYIKADYESGRLRFYSKNPDELKAKTKQKNIKI